MEDNIDDFTLEKNMPSYQIWLTGYNKNNEITDFEYLIDEFKNYSEATKCYSFFSELENIKLIKNNDPKFNIPTDLKYLTISIETVLDIDGEETNVDTIAETTINL